MCSPERSRRGKQEYKQVAAASVSCFSQVYVTGLEKQSLLDDDALLILNSGRLFALDQTALTFCVDAQRPSVTW